MLTLLAGTAISANRLADRLANYDAYTATVKN
jgi:hypothetical protein